MVAMADVARRYATNWSHHLYTLPVVVLMPHSRCNCRCVMCDIWKANQTRQEISTSDLERHVDSLAALRVGWVVLSGGEPLMHSNLWALCELLRQRRVRISLLSTGLLLERHAHDVTRWCDEVIVSLDGSPEAHDKIRRVPGAFDTLAAGVGALRNAQPGYRVTGRCVLQRLNSHDLTGVIDAARVVGLDQLSFLGVDVSSRAFNRPDGWSAKRTAEVALTPDEARAFARLVEDVIATRSDDFASGFIAETPDRLRRIARYFLAVNGLGDYPRPSCNAPWVSAVIEADGTVRPCFFHQPLGNIREQPLAAILNSDQAKAFRRGLDVTRNEICRTCVCTLHVSPWFGSSSP